MSNSFLYILLFGLTNFNFLFSLKMTGKSQNFSTSLVILTPTDRPKSVRNHRVIEVFGGVFVLSLGF